MQIAAHNAQFARPPPVSNMPEAAADYRVLDSGARTALPLRRSLFSAITQYFTRAFMERWEPSLTSMH